MRLDRRRLLRLASPARGRRRPATSCSAEHEGRTWNLVLDLGNGALGALQRHVDLRDLDAVVLSHLHPDHCVDLCGLYVAQRYDPRGPSPQRLPVHGPAGTAERMARPTASTTASGMGAEFDFRDVHGPGAVHGGPVHGHAVPGRTTRSRPTACGSRPAGARLAYTGDTDDCAGAHPAVPGRRPGPGRLGVRRRPRRRRGHPPVRAAGRRSAAVRAGGVQRLMLTHMPPWNDPEVCRAQAGAVWPGEVELAAARRDLRARRPCARRRRGTA